MRFLLMLFLLCAAPLAAETRAALVLAAQDYAGLRPLANPVSDALAVKDLLQGMGFGVTVETDRSLKRMRRALEDFREDAAGADVALVFFAGHGVEVGGLNYLIPVDAQAGTAAAIAETALPLSEVQATLAAVSPVGIVLLDACREDPFGGGSGQGRAAAPLDDAAAPAPRPGLGRIGRADGVVFAFSAAPGEVASDGQGDHSPFAEALLRHFATPGVEVRTALTLVQQDVYDRSRGRQLPYVESGLPQVVYLSGGGDLAEREQLLLAMAELGPDLRAEIEALAAAQDMPLAPLYAALISAGLGGKSGEERATLLAEAAAGYQAFRVGLAAFASEDPQVAELRVAAQGQLELGAAAAARSLLDRAAALDATALQRMQDGVSGRSVSLAQTRLLAAQAAIADLRWDLAIAGLTEATDLLAGLEGPQLDPALRHALTDGLWDLGDLYRRNGDTAAALAVYQRWQGIAAARVSEAPEVAPWQRDLMTSSAKMGDVLNLQGDVAGALEQTRRSVEIARDLAAQSPDDAMAQRDFLLGLQRLGGLQRSHGDVLGADAVLTEALALAQTLVARFPKDMLLQSDLSVAYGTLGRLRLDQGRLEGVADWMAASVDISRELAESALADDMSQRQWALALVMLGDVRVAEGVPAQAEPEYRAALSVMQDVAQRDPAHTEWQRDLATVYSKLGDANYLLGRAQPAFDAYTASLQITENLVRLDPGNVQWQVDLAISHYLLAGASSDHVHHLQTAIGLLDDLQAKGLLPGQHAGLADQMRQELPASGP